MDREECIRLKKATDHHMDGYYIQDALKITIKMFNALKPSVIGISSAFFDFKKVEHFISLFKDSTRVNGDNYG